MEIAGVGCINQLGAVHDGPATVSLQVPTLKECLRNWLRI